MSNWGKAHINNSNGFGQASRADNGFGSVYDKSESGDTVLNPEANPFADAAVAYSLRDLGLGATNIVRVRRDSDNAEQDFTASEIIDGTLLSFVGNGTGYVTIWYDQLGIHNFFQTVALQQPTLVTNGVLNTLNGKPVILRQKSGVDLISDYSVNLTSKQIFTVARGSNVDGCLLGSPSGVDHLYLYDEGQTNINANPSNDVTIDDKVNGQPTTYVSRDELYEVVKNQNLINFTVPSFTFLDDRLKFGYQSSGFSMYDMQELIIFEDIQSEVEPIEKNINNYYEIY